jgi:SlyX protein
MTAVTACTLEICMPDDRITDLEIRSAFSEDTISALNSALIDQQRRIDRLELQLEEILQMVKSAGAQSLAQSEPPPPHY